MSDSRAVQRLLAIAIFVGYAFLIIHPFRWSASLTSGLLLSLNLFIILSATYFGRKAIIIFGLFGLLTMLRAGLSLQAELALAPIVLLGLSVGIFYTRMLKINRFSQQTSTELDNIQEEKNVLSVELDHLRLESNALKQKLHRYTALKSLTENLSLALSLDKLIPLIVSETFRIVGKSNSCLFYLVDREKQELNLVGSKSSQDSRAQKLKKGDSFDQLVFKQRSRLLVMDTKKDFRFSEQDTQGALHNFRSLISVPLVREEKLVGILRLDSLLPQTYDADDLRILNIISDLAALAVENTRLYQRTERLAITDGLTGLFVHRHFQERFEQEISRAVWTNSEFALLMIDIDNFKGYNDKYGHIAGDIVLRQIGRLIKSSTNPGDVLARYGGEEFAVLLVDTPKEEALKIAETIRGNIEKEKFILRREITEVRVSVGLGFFPEDGKEKVDLIQRADQALYRAKAGGKNRICIS